MSEFLPVTHEEMKARGWEQADFVYITGDAYVDHPSFGAAIITRTLEAYGYIVKHEEESYRFNLTFDESEFETVVFRDAHDFIAAQIRQCEAVPSFVKLGVGT